MQTVSLLIKPVSGQCNLRCRYCFYHELASHGGVPGGRMTAQTAALLIRRAFEAAERSVCFAFQGGEPMLAGLDYYRSFVETVQRHCPPGVAVEYTIQTNGTGIDDAWAAFFRAHGFLVGLSLDGTRALHDANRVDAAGRGSFDAARRGLALLQKHGVPVNALCVVTSALARHPQQVYESLKKLGFSYLQFIPCLDALGAPRGENPYSLTPARYGTFLKRLFELWYRDWAAGRYVSIRQFDDCVHLLAGERASSCAAEGCCGRYLVVEADGSLYPCDFYVLPETRLGDLTTCSLAQALGCAAQAAFIRAGSRRPDACAACPYAVACGSGGCRRNFTAADGAVHSDFCPDYRDFLPLRMTGCRRLPRSSGG